MKLRIKNVSFLVRKVHVFIYSQKVLFKKMTLFTD